MNRKLLITLTVISLLACNFLFPPKTTPSPDRKNSSAPATETTIPERNTELFPISDSFTVVRLHPESGDLHAQLAREAQKALSLGQMPVVEFDAAWCLPCQAIDKGLEEKNKLMLDAYAGTYIVKLDVDEWGWGDSALHDFDFDGIPVYFKLDADGKPTGDTVDGNAWGENIPENMAPVMDRFFHGE